jgi:hypothetical protein
MSKPEYWDCHKHRTELRISDFNTVYHETRGQLCQCINNHNVTLFFPIQFKDKTAAYHWVKKGSIAELQEGHGNLKIGFVRESMKPREPHFWETDAKEKHMAELRAELDKCYLDPNYTIVCENHHLAALLELAKKKESP